MPNLQKKICLDRARLEFLYSTQGHRGFYSLAGVEGGGHTTD